MLVFRLAATEANKNKQQDGEEAAEWPLCIGDTHTRATDSVRACSCAAVTRRAFGSDRRGHARCSRDRRLHSSLRWGTTDLKSGTTRETVECWVEGGGGGGAVVVVGCRGAQAKREKKRKEKTTLSTTCESTTTGLLWSRSSWLTAVGEEEEEWGRGRWCAAHWERGIVGRGERETVGCVFSSVLHQKSLTRDFFFVLYSHGGDVPRQARTCTRGHAKKESLLAGCDGNLASSIEILFAVP